MNSSLKGPRRWRDQRWLIDSIIRTDGLEWDQPRVAYTTRPMGVDAARDFQVAKSRITKFDDIVPVFISCAEYRLAQARAAQHDGHLVAAREHYFYAALLYATAEWPVWEDSEFLSELDDKKNDCFAAYAALADHHVERVEIPFHHGFIPAWFHLPVGYDYDKDGPLQTVLMCGGMDAPKELNVDLYGDRFLSRRFAVVTFDGPGQGEAPIRGVKFSPNAWIEAGNALVAWCATRKEIDTDRMVGFGLSFGSYWMSQVAATQPSVKASVVGLVCHEPGCHTIFEEASPTFKARFMWMSGLDGDEAAFDRMVTQIDLRPLIAKMPSPWLIVAGDEDELSPIRYSYDLARSCPVPSPMLVYAQGRHALSLPTASVARGPHWITYAADWLQDRLDGIQAEDFVDYVRSDGVVERRVHPKRVAAA